MNWLNRSTTPLDSGRCGVEVKCTMSFCSAAALSSFALSEWK